MSMKYVGRFGDSLQFQLGECKIMVSGPYERSKIGWHFSISHPSRNPTWEEQKTASYQLIPDDVCMVQILPPRAEYVNLHQFCFHWYEAGPKFFDIETGRPLK